MIEPQPEEGDDSGKNDHQKVVGSVGIGWLGVSNIPLAFATPGGDNVNPTVNGFTETQIAAPAVGARIWFSEPGATACASSRRPPATRSFEWKSSVSAPAWRSTWRSCACR